jgi:glycosyltransferase involved in cell wall biosynthesis
VHTERGWRGGEQQVLYLALGLAAAGVEQEFACQSDGALARRLREAGLPVTGLSMGGFADLTTSWRLRRRILATRPDVLHAHDAQAHAIGVRAARWAGAARPRTVVARRVAYSIYRHSFLRLNRLKYTRGVDRILCISEAVRARLVADGLPADRLRVVHSGVDLARLDAVPRDPASRRREWGVPADARVVGHLGALTPEKGHAVLLRAMAPLLSREADLRLVLAGAGPLEAELRALAGELKVAEAVRFTGFLEDALAHLAAFDVFAFPSLAEGLGTTVLDALALRLPCVVSRAGGLAEIVRDEQEGLLVDPGDEEGLRRAIARLLADPALARRLGDAGRARVASTFTAARTVEGTLAAYRDLLAPPRQRDAAQPSQSRSESGR